MESTPKDLVRAGTQFGIGINTVQHCFHSLTNCGVRLLLDNTCHRLEL